MSRAHKLVLAMTMTAALTFGFLHLVVPDFSLDFDRLHIFLFNLCAGGAILLHFAQGLGRPRGNVFVYFAVSMAYAVTAFVEFYPATLVLTVPLVALVEQVRIRRFGLLPLEFFRPAATSDKFLQASLLCLSIGMTVAAAVIINNEYIHLISLDKLTIDVFFLGYSFPLSLVTMSVMFSFMPNSGERFYVVLKEVAFWTITLGVVTFFAFIIFEITAAEIVVANVLFLAVCMLYVLFLRHSERVQQRAILVSGMAFLLCTGVTGVVYLLEYLAPSIGEYNDYLLTLHATVSLYGWNLSGLLIIVRWDEFPITRRTPWVIALHWLAVMVLTPVGQYVLGAAALALPAYALLLGYAFFVRDQSGEAAR